MPFHEFILEKNLERYSELSSSKSIPSLSVNLEDIKLKASGYFQSVGQKFLSKENIIDPEAHHHKRDLKEVDHVHHKHFWNEFPRKQSNNDMSYHEEDITMRFIVGWLYGKSED